MQDWNHLPDTQNEADQRGIPIDRVGVREIRYPASYLDEDGLERSTVATFEMTVELPAHLKGTHMSRFVEALHDFRQPLSGTSLAKLTAELASRLNAERAQIACEFTIFRQKLAPVSGMAGMIDYEAGIEYRHDTGNDGQLFLSLEIPVATLCPCSKAISERGAHNQRGKVTLSIEAVGEINFYELIILAEASASCELYSGLKRADEKAVTERAYDQPVFVEDLVRNVATGLRQHPAVNWFRVEAENFESIHNHNAYAMIEA